MTDYAKKEDKAVEKIVATIEKLEVTVTKLDETDSKVKSFVEQEKAIHEIKKIVHEVKKVDKLEAKETEDTDYLIKSIGDEFAALDATLEKLDDNEGKVKSFFEQEKAIHEVKKLLHKAGKLDKLS